MAIKPVVLLAALGAGYFLTKKDAAQTSNTPKGSGEDPLKNLPPPPPKDEPTEELPPINDDLKPEPKGDGNPNMKIDMAKFYGSNYFVTGNEQPADPSVNDLWVSQSCLSWGIGKDYPGLLPEVQVIPDSKNIDKLISALDWWKDKTFTPAPYYYAHLPVDLPYRNWARTLIQFYTSCGKNIPQRKDFKSYKDYQASLSKFESTPVGKLYRTLYRMVGDAMLEDWEKNHPSEAINEQLKYWSLWAVRSFPNLSVSNKTDEAYKKAFPDGPKKLDPKNPQHAEYIADWQYMYMEIKSLINYIKQHGDNTDPLL